VSLRRFFLLAFVLALAAAAFLAIGVVLAGRWGELEVKILITTVSIGVYSLIALCCATVYDDARWKSLAIAGIAVCGLGLVFALLTNWQVVEPGLKSLIRVRIAFLSLAMALAATALMLRTTPTQDVVRFSRGATLFLIWLTTLLFNYIIFGLADTSGDKSGIVKLVATSTVLALLGLVTAPILRRVYPCARAGLVARLGGDVEVTADESDDLRRDVFRRADFEDRAVRHRL
jgi:hypothetical protein